jgi:hypothetical protein
VYRITASMSSRLIGRRQLFGVHDGDELAPTFATIAGSGAQGVLVVAGSLTYTHYQKIADLALHYRLPSVHAFRETVAAGGLLSLGPNMAEIARTGARYVVKLLKGASPGTLPVEQPTRYDVHLNLRTAQALGLVIPPAVLVLADEVIQQGGAEERCRSMARVAGRTPMGAASRRERNRTCGRTGCSQPNQALLVPREPRHLGLRSNPMKWVVVPQGGRPARGNSPLTKAPPAGQEGTPRAPPVRGVRSWRDRGRRPRERAPKYVEWWSTGSASRCREGKPTVCSARTAAVLDAPRRVCRTPPGSESGAGVHRGDSGTWVSPLVSWGHIRRRRADRRGKDSRRGEEASAAHTSLARPRDTQPETRPKASGKEREHRTPPSWASGSLRGAASRRLGAVGSWSGRWGTEVPGPHGRAGDAGHHGFWKALWERRRAHQPSPCNSRALPRRPRAIRRGGATPCCP